jgi:hypothetical protein
MRKNLFGELMIEPKDIALGIFDELQSSEFCSLGPKNNTKRGIEVLNGHAPVKLIHDRPHLYVVYRNGLPLYVGMTACSIWNRLSRFVSEVLGNTTDNESHPAALKYLREYGVNFEGLSVKCVVVNTDDWPSHIKMKEVEEELIRKIKPRYNIEIYKRRYIEDVRITLD